MDRRRKGLFTATSLPSLMSKGEALFNSTELLAIAELDFMSFSSCRLTARSAFRWARVLFSFKGFSATPLPGAGATPLALAALLVDVANSVATTVKTLFS
jgi:hypothetical protein